METSFTARWQGRVVMIFAFALGLIVASAIFSTWFKPVMLLSSLVALLLVFVFNNRIILKMVYSLSAVGLIVGLIGLYWQKVGWLSVALWGFTFLVSAIRHWRSVGFK